MANSPSETNRTDTVASHAARESKPAAPIGADTMPLADDDADPAPAPAAPVEAAEPVGQRADETGQRERAPPPVNPFQARRDEALKRFRELRDEAAQKEKDEAAAEAGDDPAEPPAAEGAQPAPGADAPEPGAPKSPAVASPPQTPEAKHTLIVDGKTVEMSTDEMRRHAQIALASDNRLEESKRILRDAQETAQRLRGPAPEHPPGQGETTQGQPDPSQATSAEHQPPKIDPDKLRSISERIQTGDSQDGVDATTELVELVLAAQPKAGPEPSKVDEVVRNILVQERAKTEVSDAIAQFSKDNQDIVGNQYLKQAAMTAVGETMIAEMAKVGLPEADIRKNCDTPEKVVTAYGFFRNQGHPLPAYKQVLDTGAQALRNSLGMKTPSDGNPPPPSPPPARPQAPSPSASEQRLERKRAAPSQPRSAGVRGAVAPAAQPKSQVERIQEERIRRGFRH